MLPGQNIIQKPDRSGTEPKLNGPADLFYRKRTGALGYVRFGNVAAAVGYARQRLNSKELGSCVLEVGDRRFENAEFGKILAAIPSTLSDAA